MTKQSFSDNPLALWGHFVLDGENYITQRYVSLQSLIATRQSDGASLTLQIQDIVRSFTLRSDGDPEQPIEANGTESLSEKDWNEATRRYGKLQILLEASHPTRKLVKEIADELGKSPATIYRWRAQFAKNGKIADLAPVSPTGGRGKARVNETTEAIIQEVLDESYLSSQKLKPTKIMPDIEVRCRRAGVNVPHINTVRRRIQALDEQSKIRAREGTTASKKFKPAPGRFPGADYPNAVWQIDHTPTDICIVDDTFRLNIGRCWITVAIDVFSRCVTGYYLSLDKPNAASVGMCLVNAILPKDGWLAAHGIKAPWPIWGRPKRVLADNDKTFRCDMVTRAAKQYRIDLEWRPVRTPHWGGHIERLLNTFNQEIQTLPGTTFSNPAQRGDYKPHEKAELTFAELETYIAEYLCGVYHQKFHAGIRRSPIKRYETGILGDGIQIGTGLPEPEADPARLRLDFLPYKECTVQSYGIAMDNITYYDPSIDAWIHAKDPKTKKKRKFICRRDPRDISVIWFLDPIKDIYLRIPYRNIEYPSINLWELREVRRQLTKEGYREVNEALIFETYERLQSIRRNASQATQEVRKATQKKKVYKSKAAAEQAQVDKSHPRSLTGPNRQTQSPSSSPLDTWNDDDIVERFVETSTH